jgi:hypothetical protein
MKSFVTVTALFAASTTFAADICPRGAEYLHRLQQTGMSARDLASFIHRAQAMCAQPESAPAPANAQEYQAQVHRDHQQRLQRMQATPEAPKIKLWN